LPFFRNKNSGEPFLPPEVYEMFLRWIKKATGIFFILLSVHILLSVITFSPTDPSFNTASDGNYENALGFLGAITSDILLQFFGFASIYISIVFSVWGGYILKNIPVSPKSNKIITLCISTVFCSILLASLPFFDAKPVMAGAGGAIGMLADTHLRTLLVSHNISQDFIWIVIPLYFFIFAFYSMLTLSITFSQLKDFCIKTKSFCLKIYRVIKLLFSGIWSEFVNGKKAVNPFEKQSDYQFDDEEDEDDEFEDINSPLAIENIVEKLDNKKQNKKVAKKAAKKSIFKKSKENLVEHSDSEDDLDLKKLAKKTGALEQDDASKGYELPPLELLGLPKEKDKKNIISDEELNENARELEKVLAEFGVKGQIVKIRPGPVVTLYELEPAPGTKTSRVVGLSDDIARSMSAVSVRIAVVAGRSTIGIELPNSRRETVYLRELMAADEFVKNKNPLTITLGKDLGGKPIFVDLAKMPHLLIAGTTGSGKSVAVNSMILSLLYRLEPKDCRLIMIDPKMLEFTPYNGIPHLLTPVVTDPGKAVVALKWAVREMEDRYKAMSQMGVRNIDGYNKKLKEAVKKGQNLKRVVQTGFDPETGKPIYEEQDLDLTPMPYIVIIVDEMADLMMVAGKDVEAAIQRLAQMARAAGLHLIMSTQRPSVDVITGTVKANFPTRISLSVTSKIDSRTILGEQGAEKLLGRGDMLYMAAGQRPSRVHGPFVEDSEVAQIVEHLANQEEPKYVTSVTEDNSPSNLELAIASASGGGSNDKENALYDQAVAVVLNDRKVSTSYIQRKLRIGYNKAASLVERMEEEGLIGAANHVGKREILVPEQQM
jgi:S-DNA-T family DNA segregation ATPase FtsK/SpoIIIE